MLRLDLAELERRGALSLDEVVPAADPLWESTDLRLREPVRVRLQASPGAAGQIVVRGTARTHVDGECRRCLAELDLPLAIELLTVFVPEGGELTEGDEPADESLRPYDPGDREVDLSGWIREELVLSAPAWPVCRPDCRGLCPVCGVDLNESTCTCVREASDPRWATLRALRPEE